LSVGVGVCVVGIVVVVVPVGIDVEAVGSAIDPRSKLGKPPPKSF